MDGIGELIEKLCIANLKLWAVCDQKDAYVKGGEVDPEKLRALMEKDLALCRTRAELRKEINLRLGGPQGDNVKCYGKEEARWGDGNKVLLLPCPLCQQPASIKAAWDTGGADGAATVYFAQCLACDCKTVLCGSAQAAQERWNGAPMRGRSATAPPS